MTAEPFLFGKLPSHGDFVWRGLTAEAHDVWDAWASAEIKSAAAALGEGFAGAHETALPCRFVAGPGELGDTWRAGALAPSIDSAGRRFLVVAGLEGLEPHQAAVLGAAIADRCEGVLRRALVGPLSVDETLSLLIQDMPCAGELGAAAAMGVNIASVGVWWRPGDGSVCQSSAPPPGLVSDALDRATQAGEVA